MTIARNTVLHGGSYGIRVFGGTGSSVSDNAVGGVTTGRGIGLLSTGTTAASGNTVSGNGVGIFLNNTTGSTLTGNTVTGNSGDRCPGRRRRHGPDGHRQRHLRQRFRSRQ